MNLNVDFALDFANVAVPSSLKAIGSLLTSYLPAPPLKFSFLLIKTADGADARRRHAPVNHALVLFAQ